VEKITTCKIEDFPDRLYLWHLADYKSFLVERRKRVAERLNEFLGCGNAV